MANLNYYNITSLEEINILPQYWQSLKPQFSVSPSTGESWKKKMEFMDEISIQNNVVVFLWNAYTNRFLYVSDKLKTISYHDPELFTADNGTDRLLSLIHPKHLQATLELIEELIVNYCAKNGKTDFKNVSISLNYLFKNGLGEYLQILHRPIILEIDDKLRPTLVMNITHHVDHIKKDDSIGGVIVTKDDNFIFDYNLDKKCIEAPKKISEQEMKVLQLLGRGLDTKAIANKLFISPHTVDTHRRNIIKKTSCMDTTGVVAFAKLVGLI